MEITRTLSTEGRRITLRVQASFSGGEMRIIDKYKMRNYRIQTRDGPFGGKDAISLNLKSAFRAQFGKVKNRWSAALIRTTGFVLSDLILLFISFVVVVIKAVLKIFIGRRKRLGGVINGIVIKSKRVERIKEAEFFIFISLAAIGKAIAYAESLDEERLFKGPELFSEIEGLDFAGAGGLNESEFDEINMLSDKFSKVG